MVKKWGAMERDFLDIIMIIIIFLGTLITGYAIFSLDTKPKRFLVVSLLGMSMVLAGLYQLGAMPPFSSLLK